MLLIPENCPFKTGLGFCLGHGEWVGSKLLKYDALGLSQWSLMTGDPVNGILTYQSSTLASCSTVAPTGNGELVFDSGEAALKTATTFTNGSRRVTYPIVITLR